jgi:hypothetical protein
MTSVPTAAIELLWFEPGSPCDAAAAVRASTNGHAFGADDVREIWRKAQAEGRLPPFKRPEMGFAAPQRALLLRLQQGGRKASPTTRETSKTQRIG